MIFNIDKFQWYKEFVESKETILRALRLVFSHSPVLTSLNIILVVIQGLLPLATLYVMKLIVDTITTGISSPDKDALYSSILFLLGLAACVALIQAICRACASYSNEIQSLAIMDMIAAQIQKHSLQLDLSFYENSSYQDKLHRAQIEGPSRPYRIVWDLVQIGQNSISLISIGSIILFSMPVLGIILVGSALPAMVARMWYSRKLYDLIIKMTETERRSRYYHLMMTHRHNAREVRLFGLGDLFLQRYRQLLQTLRSERLAISRSQAIWDVLTQGLLTIAIFGSFAIIAMMAIHGSISLGDLVMFFMGFQMSLGYIQSVFSGFNALYGDQLFLRNLFSFLDITPKIIVPGKPQQLPEQIQNEIRFEDVTFTYPDAEKPALSGITISIKKGEILALVGNNGAGKTTFINLLCRMYEPDSGRITVDRLDLDTVDPNEWRKKITVLFQDYVKYYLDARENIWLGDISRESDESDIEQAAQNASADRIIKKLPESYSTILGKFFAGGHDLSTGEWQKIALARAFYRNAEIVILDEPASSLDAIAEAEIFHRFRQLVKDRTAIIISHRFSTVLLADRIVVIDQGRIIEHGTHSELMTYNGHYAKMFRAQADPYR